MERSRFIDDVCKKLELAASAMGAKLDYSENSVSQLEDLLLVVKDQNDVASLTGAEFMVGIYLGEIIRNLLKKGEWFVQQDEKIYILKIEETNIYPVEKVRKFTANPNGEGLKFFVSTVVAKLR